MNNHSLLFGMVGGLLAVATEFAMKRHGFAWTANVWWLVPVAVGINYCVYRLVQGPPSVIAAFVLFAATTLTARVLGSLLLGQHIGVGTWAAVGLMVTATVLRLWRP